LNSTYKSSDVRQRQISIRFAGLETVPEGKSQLELREHEFLRKQQSYRKGKVLIVVENLSVPFDRRVWRECRALTEAGYQVSAISPMGTGTDTSPRETIDGVSIYRYPILPSDGSFVSYILEYSIASVMSFWLMWVVLFRKGFEVIQICNPPDLLILIALPFKLFGKKVIFDQHDLSPEIYQVQKGRQKRDLVVGALLCFEKMTYLFSDVVMVVNESCRRIAVGRGSKREQDVFVVRNGPSLQNITSVQPNPALRHGMKYLLSYVGMMGPQEGIDILLRAIRDLVAVHGRRDFHVRIMGGGTVLDRMKLYAVELGINHMVTFTGSVDYAQVMEGIATADLCLCPDPKTPLSDKCSLVKAIEYMSLGRAFVAFDLEEVHDFGADAGVYARPNDEGDFAAKINNLLDNVDLRASMGNIGRERVMQRLTWEHSKEALYAAYDKAFHKGVGAMEKAAK
jgi:glycosyltransferase involved in cell wall biosynthesis